MLTAPVVMNLLENIFTLLLVLIQILDQRSSSLYSQLVIYLVLFSDVQKYAIQIVKGDNRCGVRYSNTKREVPLIVPMVIKNISHSSENQLLDDFGPKFQPKPNEGATDQSTKRYIKAINNSNTQLSNAELFEQSIHRTGRSAGANYSSSWESPTEYKSLNFPKDKLDSLQKQHNWDALEPKDSDPWSDYEQLTKQESNPLQKNYTSHKNRDNNFRCICKLLSKKLQNIREKNSFELPLKDNESSLANYRKKTDTVGKAPAQSIRSKCDNNSLVPISVTSLLRPYGHGSMQCAFIMKKNDDDDGANNIVRHDLSYSHNLSNNSLSNENIFKKFPSNFYQPDANSKQMNNHSVTDEHSLNQYRSNHQQTDISLDQINISTDKNSKEYFSEQDKPNGLLSHFPKIHFVSDKNYNRSTLNGHTSNNFQHVHSNSNQNTSKSVVLEIKPLNCPSQTYLYWPYNCNKTVENAQIPQQQGKLYRVHYNSDPGQINNSISWDDRYHSDKFLSNNYSKIGDNSDQISVSWTEKHVSNEFLNLINQTPNNTKQGCNNINEFLSRVYYYNQTKPDKIQHSTPKNRLHNPHEYLHSIFRIQSSNLDNNTVGKGDDFQGDDNQILIGLDLVNNNTVNDRHNNHGSNFYINQLNNSIEIKRDHMKENPKNIYRSLLDYEQKINASLNKFYNAEKCPSNFYRSECRIDPTNDTLEDIECNSNDTFSDQKNNNTCTITITSNNSSNGANDSTNKSEITENNPPNYLNATAIKKHIFNFVLNFTNATACDRSNFECELKNNLMLTYKIMPLLKQIIIYSLYQKKLASMSSNSSACLNCTPTQSLSADVSPSMAIPAEIHFIDIETNDLDPIYNKNILYTTGNNCSNKPKGISMDHISSDEKYIANDNKNISLINRSRAFILPVHLENVNTNPALNYSYKGNNQTYESNINTNNKNNTLRIHPSILNFVNKLMMSK